MVVCACVFVSEQKRENHIHFKSIIPSSSSNISWDRGKWVHQYDACMPNLSYLLPWTPSNIPYSCISNCLLVLRRVSCLHSQFQLVSQLEYHNLISSWVQLVLLPPFKLLLLHSRQCLIWRNHLNQLLPSSGRHRCACQLRRFQSLQNHPNRRRLSCSMSIPSWYRGTWVFQYGSDTKRKYFHYLRRTYCIHPGGISSSIPQPWLPICLNIFFKRYGKLFLFFSRKKHN